jgi:hypothetical protein
LVADEDGDEGLDAPAPFSPEAVQFRFEGLPLPASVPGVGAAGTRGKARVVSAQSVGTASDSADQSSESLEDEEAQDGGEGWTLRLREADEVHLDDL